VEKTATFGAGCFWGVEAAFRQIDGVTRTRVGYSGGTLAHPTYEDVCSHTTGHAEVVAVTYDFTLPTRTRRVSRRNVSVGGRGGSRVRACTS
jgi:methionine-S-sulfoxide reductase